ncbi:MAG: type IV secretion system protein [Wolbachia endosymbiont of Tyrophagus putrescentiae]|nr:type IV secretion system protein [Wolbachia endosymbiont of Tyrophagus putrescentiae]
MLRFLLIISLFALSGCDGCIQPQDIGVREKLEVVLAKKQEWINSGVEISGRAKVTDINIVPTELNFCSEGGVINKDFLVKPGMSSYALPFDLRSGDKISFSVIGSKICKSDDGKTRHIKIDESCSKQEKEYVAKILNKEDCSDGVCPNKYLVGYAEWLNGKEYWSINEEEEKKSVEGAIKLDCSELRSVADKIDTYLLNTVCGKICSTGESDCIQVESFTGKEKLIENLKSVKNQEDGEKIATAVKELSEEMKSYIPLLSVELKDESFEHIDGIRTNYDHGIRGNYSRSEKLVFNLVNYGKGGYNIRVTKTINPDNSLYIHVANDLPGHKPGSSEDISVDISRVNDVEYIDKIVKQLNERAGTIYYGIKDHGCGYKNQGQFAIYVRTKSPPVKTFSSIYNFFDKAVKEAFFGSNYKGSKINNSEFFDAGDSPTRRLYESFIASNRTTTIRSTIVALLTLYIVLYTLYYFFGLSHISIYDFLIICIRIGIIAQLLRDSSWNFFYNNAFSLFVNAPTQLMEIANFRGGNANVFEFLDLPLNRFLSWHSVLVMVSLIFYGPLGIVAFCLMIWGIIMVSLSIFNALFSFITSVAIIALLLSLAPLFIICVLFQYTRRIFLEWIKYLAKFALHPVVLLIFISLISQMMDYIVYSVLNIEVCSKCVIEIDLKIIKPCIFYAFAPKYMPNIAAIIAFIILGHAMKAVVNASSEISDTLFGSYVQDDPGKEYKQTILGIAGFDDESKARRGDGPAQSARRQTPQIPNRPSGS